MKNESLGMFQENADFEYFGQLQELVNLVHEKWVGGPYPFNDLVKADVKEFLELLRKA